MIHDQATAACLLADMATLAQMLEEHRPRLRVMLRRRIDPGLAPQIEPDDIISETFLLARRRWRKFKEETSVAPHVWLYRLTRDCLIEAWRKRYRAGRDQVMPLPPASSADLGLQLVSLGTSPSGAVARRELQQQMREALAKLRERDREILWLRHYDDLSFADAGFVLGLTENAATVRYVRALRRLKALWLELHPDSESQT